MAKIHIMKDSLASKVAAGEVVERPASVVKELIENSVDAGASSVEVDIDKGGIVLIRVADDGDGMSREDTILAVERHATSKLRNASDLSNLSTYGFRGEALPSIASVSRFCLSSCEKSSLVGTEVIIEGGKLVDVCDSGNAPGTQVEVRDLFFNVPARRKFLRTQATEFGHIEEVVREAAVARPDVAFTLRHDSREIIRLAGDATQIDRIADLVGFEIIEHLIKFNGHDDTDKLSVSGWISEPGFSRRNRRLQYTFLNGRPIKSPAVSCAIKDAYAGLIERGAFPSAFVFITADPSSVDVNVHPSKREVRFHQYRSLKQLISSSLKRAVTSQLNDNLPGEMAAKAFRPMGGSGIGVTCHTGSKEFSQVSPGGEDNKGPESDEGSEGPVLWKEATLRESQIEADLSNEEGAEHRIIGILDKRYLVIEGRDGLVLLHRRAAHERILYEEVLRNIESGGVASQALLAPVTVGLSAHECQVIMEHSETLHGLGLRIETFGENTIKIDSLPASCAGVEPVEFFLALVAELCEGGTQSARRFSESDIVGILSSRAARYSEARTIEELEALVSRLMQCDVPYCDIRGRPTMVQFSTRELERRFAAIQR